MDADKIPEEWVEAGARALAAVEYRQRGHEPEKAESLASGLFSETAAADSIYEMLRDDIRDRTRAVLAVVLPMVAEKVEAGGSGKVTRGKLREALSAAEAAAQNAIERRTEWGDDSFVDSAEEDALAAALGLEVEG